MYNDLEFKLDSFEGPMDLMLYLIKKNKLDIYDIPISDLADQFFEYVIKYKEHSLELSSDFLYAMSELFEIKSRMLIPTYDGKDYEMELDEDPRQTLIQRLIEYKKVIQRRDVLEDRYSEYSNRYFRDEPITLKISKNETEEQEQIYDSKLLVEAMKNLIDNLGEIDTLREKFFEKLRTNQNKYMSVEDRSKEIFRFLFHCEKEELNFEQLLEDGGYMEVLITFLAILELMKLGKISASQTNESIVLKLKEARHRNIT